MHCVCFGWTIVNAARKFYICLIMGLRTESVFPLLVFNHISYIFALLSSCLLNLRPCKVGFWIENAYNNINAKYKIQTTHTHISIWLCSQYVVWLKASRFRYTLYLGSQQTIFHIWSLLNIGEAYKFLALLAL